MHLTSESYIGAHVVQRPIAWYVVLDCQSGKAYPYCRAAKSATGSKLPIFPANFMFRGAKALTFQINVAFWPLHPERRLSKPLYLDSRCFFCGAGVGEGFGLWCSYSALLFHFVNGLNQVYCFE